MGQAQNHEKNGQENDKGRETDYEENWTNDK
jgi:hypothetical protein